MLLLERANIEFSCPAARSHVLKVLRTVLILLDDAQGVNCNDLLGCLQYSTEPNQSGFLIYLHFVGFHMR